MTHPFHLLAGRDFEFVAYRQNWGDDRVCLHGEKGRLFSLPAGRTDAVAADPFVVVAAGVGAQNPRRDRSAAQLKPLAVPSRYR